MDQSSKSVTIPPIPRPCRGCGVGEAEQHIDDCPEVRAAVERAGISLDDSMPPCPAGCNHCHLTGHAPLGVTCRDDVASTEAEHGATAMWKRANAANLDRAIGAENALGDLRVQLRRLHFRNPLAGRGDLSEANRSYYNTDDVCECGADWPCETAVLLEDGVNDSPAHSDAAVEAVSAAAGKLILSGVNPGDAYRAARQAINFFELTASRSNPTATCEHWGHPEGEWKYSCCACSGIPNGCERCQVGD